MSAVPASDGSHVAVQARHGTAGPAGNGRPLSDVLAEFAEGAVRTGGVVPRPPLLVYQELPLPTVAAENADAATDDFVQHRSLLFAIAYRMLGSVMDAEDAVQDAWLRFSAARPAEVRSPHSFLVTIVTRLCLDRLKSARARRETYVGTWLPEPLVTAADPSSSPEALVAEHESLSMAFLVLLESLSPLERAAFILHEVFAFDFGEIAHILNRRPAACRQLYHRAKQHVEEHRPRYEATPAQVQRLALAFIAASAQGDLGGLIRLLADDVTLWSDGGGKAAAALNPIHGAGNVATLLLAIIKKAPAGLSVAAGQMNERPAIALYAGERPYGVLIVDADNQRVRSLYSIVNPDKLGHLRRTSQRSDSQYPYTVPGENHTRVAAQ